MQVIRLRDFPAQGACRQAPEDQISPHAMASQPSVPSQWRRLNLFVKEYLRDFGFRVVSLGSYLASPYKPTRVIRPFQLRFAPKLALCYYISTDGEREQYTTCKLLSPRCTKPRKMVIGRRSARQRIQSATYFVKQGQGRYIVRLDFSSVNEKVDAHAYDLDWIL